MQRLFDIILKFKEHILFLGLIFISLSLILLGDINRIGGFRALVVASLGWFQKNVFLIPNVSALKSENSALRELNFFLSQRVMNARISEIENQALKNLLGLKQRLDAPFEVAQVVGAVTIDMRNYLIIDKGLKFGIDKYMTVRNDAGLVGSVVISGSNYSLVEIILNAKVKVPAMNLRNGVLGTINWDGENRLLFRDVPKFVDVKVGDTIVTSKHSLKYMTYVPIGTVVSIEAEEGELFAVIVVKPFVNFSLLEEVFVIKKVIDPEIVSLIKKFEQIVVNTNLPPDKAQKIATSRDDERKEIPRFAEKKQDEGKMNNTFGESTLKNFYLKFIYYSIATLLICVVQLSFSFLISIKGIIPDLLILLVIWITLHDGKIVGLISAFCIGLLYDYLSLNIFGVNALTKTLVAT